MGVATNAHRLPVCYASCLCACIKEVAFRTGCRQTGPTMSNDVHRTRWKCDRCSSWRRDWETDCRGRCLLPRNCRRTACYAACHIHSASQFSHTDLPTFNSNHILYGL